MTESFLRRQGQPFVIHRGGEQIGEAVGVKSEKEREIVFVRGVELFVGDWLEDQRARAWYRVTDVGDASLPSSRRRSNIRVLYETKIEYERQESAAQVIAMLDDIADAIWTLSDEKMPPEKKERARALVRELQGIVRSLPPGVAGGLAGEIASRFSGSAGS